MTTKKFSKGEAINFGWNTVKSNLGFFIGLLIIVLLISIVSVVNELLIRENIPILYIIISIASSVLQVVVGMALIKIALRFCDNEKGKFADLFSCLPLFFNYLFGSILFVLIVFVGMILLIIPGIIWSIKFQFFSYLIIDKGLGPIEALKMSSAITKDAKWDLFLFFLLILAINLLGALALLVGLFVTIPITMVAIAFVYRKLLAHAEVVQTPENPFQAPA